MRFEAALLTAKFKYCLKGNMALCFLKVFATSNSPISDMLLSIFQVCVWHSIYFIVMFQSYHRYFEWVDFELLTAAEVLNAVLKVTWLYDGIAASNSPISDMLLKYTQDLCLA